MRQIKFRGISVTTNEFVYGDLLRSETRAYISKNFLDIDERSCEVKPDSVRQLVGTDSKGFEVYEGDVVIARAKEMHAMLVPMPHPRDAFLKEPSHEEILAAVED